MDGILERARGGADAIEAGECGATPERPGPKPGRPSGAAKEQASAKRTSERAAAPRAPSGPGHLVSGIRHAAPRSTCAGRALATGIDSVLGSR